MVDAFFVVFEKFRIVITIRHLDVVVQITIAQMPEVHQAHPRNFLRELHVGFFNKRRDGRNR